MRGKKRPGHSDNHTGEDRRLGLRDSTEGYSGASALPSGRPVVRGGFLFDVMCHLRPQIRASWASTKSGQLQGSSDCAPLGSAVGMHLPTHSFLR